MTAPGVPVPSLRALLRELRGRQAENKRCIARARWGDNKEFWRGCFHGTASALELIEPLIEPLIAQEAGR
jgi:hypothetical protein